MVDGWPVLITSSRDRLALSLLETLYQVVDRSASGCILMCGQQLHFYSIGTAVVLMSTCTNYRRRDVYALTVDTYIELIIEGHVCNSCSQYNNYAIHNCNACYRRHAIYYIRRHCSSHYVRQSFEYVATVNGSTQSRGNVVISNDALRLSKWRPRW